MRPLRVAYDARGGGLGHMRRSLAILRAWRQLNPRLEALVLCSSAHPAPLLAEGWPLVRLPSAFEVEGRPELLGLAPALLAAAGPFDGLVVDSFPQGLLGEWQEAEALAPFPHRALIARPGAQLAAGPAAWQHFDLALVPQAQSPWPEAEAIGHVLATPPQAALSRKQARQALAISDEAPLILVPLGAEPGEALALALLVNAASHELQAQGFGHHLRLVGPSPLAGWGSDPRVLVHDPLAELLLGADVVLGAAGANLIAELEAFGGRALLRPLKRSHDDQAWRARGWQSIESTASPKQLAAALQQALALPPAPPGPCPQGAQNAAQALQKLFSKAHPLP